MQHPSYRLIQLGVRSLGYNPGDIDEWYGPNTHGAASALLAGGPKVSSAWAVKTLHRGLQGLGYLSGEVTSTYDVATKSALRALVEAGGMPLASAAAPDEVLRPVKPLLRRIEHDNVMLQGSAETLIDTFCIHCGALPGDWHVYRSNQEMFDAIVRMHTAPKSQGGRGWSGPGYHSITFPDGTRWDARSWRRYGAGALGYNRGVYHHLMIEVETINRMGKIEDWFTPETIATTKNHVEEIAQRTPLRRLMGHNEVAAKLCPGGPIIDADWTDRAVA